MRNGPVDRPDSFIDISSQPYNRPVEVLRVRCVQKRLRNRGHRARPKGGVTSFEKRVVSYVKVEIDIDYSKCKASLDCGKCLRSCP